MYGDRSIYLYFHIWNVSEDSRVVMPCCYYMISFNYGGKKARDVSTCRCLLSNVMPDSIFYDSMEWGIICSFLRVITTVFLSIKEIDSVVLS